MIHPAGIATDDTDNIYVSSWHKLQKFTSSGELIKCIGRRGRKEGEFDDPRGVTLYDNQVYVCDCNNRRIQVFDPNLNFVRSIGSHGKGRGELDAPHDVKFDTARNMYVAEWGNRRVQVMDTSGQFIRVFGQEGEGKLCGPSGLHIADKYVYVSDWSGNCIVVYETSGQFVTSFGRRGQKEREFRGPYCITSCVDGFMHVCDFGNCRVQIF
ncbi:E3 ubiquitin-protein ligase TRIM71 [Geodia barretti]|uniref:E3 ubiquitin-protein ligase TRIM71 n=1 Tax=Geodia barretti TaxID=519541 RepID=A0AA35SJR2_GEOBA|nr:E3 ubiquitin-protein ligase TRIM71 [Geodia barretti]